MEKKSLWTFGGYQKSLHQIFYLSRHALRENVINADL